MSLSDFYTPLERTLYIRLKNVMTQHSKDFSIFNQVVSKRAMGDVPVAISIVKAGDTPDLASGGGQSANLWTPVKNNQDTIVGYDKTPWPSFYSVLYQIHVLADQGHLDDLRYLETVVRQAFPAQPNNTFFLYDTTVPAAPVLTGDKATSFYGGYINRDMPDNEMFWRVFILKVEVMQVAQTFEHTNVPFMGEITMEIESEGSVAKIQVIS